MSNPNIPKEINPWPKLNTEQKNYNSIWSHLVSWLNLYHSQPGGLAHRPTEVYTAGHVESVVGLHSAGTALLPGLGCSSGSHNGSHSGRLRDSEHSRDDFKPKMTSPLG